MEWRNTHWVWASTWGLRRIGPDAKHELADVDAAIEVEGSLAECVDATIHNRLASNDGAVGDPVGDGPPGLREVCFMVEHHEASHRRTKCEQGHVATGTWGQRGFVLGRDGTTQDDACTVA